jgi:hypothetical protein
LLIAGSLRPASRVPYGREHRRPPSQRTRPTQPRPDRGRAGAPVAGARPGARDRQWYGHAAHFAATLPGWRWQPSDGDARSLASIAAWCDGLANVLAPLTLDVLANPWPGVPAIVDAVFCANLLHIAPWATCAGLMRGAARHLAARGLLLTYGPYIVDGEPTAASNLAFDADLRSRDPAWGLRRLADVAAQAAAVGLRLRERVAMPANNLLLVFERGPPSTMASG